jgi:hypothetical protein
VPSDLILLWKLLAPASLGGELLRELGELLGVGALAGNVHVPAGLQVHPGDGLVEKVLPDLHQLVHVLLGAVVDGARAARQLIILQPFTRQIVRTYILY